MHIAVLMACLILPSAAAAGTVRASCHEEGRIVYREDFSADATDEKRILIAAQNPSAMCIFLDVIPETETPSINPTDAEEGGLPDNIVAAAAGNGTVEDEDLEAALNVLTGGGARRGSAKSAAKTFTASKRSSGLTSSDLKIAKASGEMVNLTLGIYKDMPLSDVKAHWKLMKEGSKVLSKMTPTINAVQNITMVSVEHVPDELAVTLCEEAQKMGAGCLAVY